MHRHLAAALAALSFIASGAEAASSDAEEIRELRAQLELLSARVKELEQRAGVAPAVAQDPTAPPMPAESPAPAAAAVIPAADPAVDWARKLSLKGDFRVRHERLERDGLPDRDRQRLRARVALTAKPLETVDVTVGIASGGDDPRSANATFGSSFTRKDIGLDLAYVDWHPHAELHFYGGKMRYPAFKPAFTAFIDGDLTPEGLAAGWRSDSGVFANTFGFWVEERAIDVDSLWYAAQLGWTGEIGPGLTLTAAAAYHDFANVRGEMPFYLGQPFGNSTNPEGGLEYDYDLGQLALELGFDAGIPVLLFGEYDRNFAADALDTAWTLGVLFGKAAAPGQWEFGYAYGDLEKDALFAQVIESDFADGRTDSRGHFVRAAYVIAKNWTANLQLYLNEINVSGENVDFDRLQLDLNFKY